MNIVYYTEFKLVSFLKVSSLLREFFDEKLSEYFSK